MNVEAVIPVVLPGKVTVSPVWEADEGYISKFLYVPMSDNIDWLK